MVKHTLVLAATLAVSTALTPAVYGAVFGHDDRVPLNEADTQNIDRLTNATGGIACEDGSWGSGFIVDVSDYVQGNQDFYIVATTSKVLHDPDTGESRGVCWFLPAVALGHNMLISEYLAGDSRVANADSDDWAFAKINRHGLNLEPLPVAFADTYDFGRDIHLELSTVSFVRAWDTVAYASGCEPDDKSRYTALWRHKEDVNRMVLHNCDFLDEGRGGPLMYLSDGEFFAIAINAGDGGGREFPRLSGIPYDPRRSFHNFARRFDDELEQKLVAFVSRFAHIKNPSATIQAFSELIRNIQTELTRLGYDSGPIDGLLGVKTLEAIQAFQATLNITPTGQVSEELLLLLKLRE